MSGAFDPYHRWLGIPPEEQPPDHYRLLGVNRFESDPAVIETAADRQMRHLRTYETGPHSALAQRLVNELAAARGVLTSADKRIYDFELRRLDEEIAGLTLLKAHVQCAYKEAALLPTRAQHESPEQVATAVARLVVETRQKVESCLVHFRVLRGTDLVLEITSGPVMVPMAWEDSAAESACDGAWLLLVLLARKASREVVPFGPGYELPSDADALAQALASRFRQGMPDWVLSAPVEKLHRLAEVAGAECDARIARATGSFHALWKDWRRRGQPTEAAGGAGPEAAAANREAKAAAVAATLAALAAGKEIDPAIAHATEPQWREYHQRRWRELRRERAQRRVKAVWFFIFATIAVVFIGESHIFYWVGELLAPNQPPAYGEGPDLTPLQRGWCGLAGIVAAFVALAFYMAWHELREKHGVPREPLIPDDTRAPGPF